MIIYGRRSSTIKAAELTNEKCPSCQTQGSLIMGIYSRYAHIFWIPMFPIGKTGISQCQHCKQVLKLNEMPAELKYHYQTLKAQSNVPKWQFIGLIIIAFLVIMTIISTHVGKKNEAQYLATPQCGDIYKYKSDNGNYSTWKLTKITKDSLAVALNNYEITKITGIYKIDKPENYSDSSVWMSKTEVSKMYSEGKIFGINR
jgi:hypothetical protein